MEQIFFIEVMKHDYIYSLLYSPTKINSCSLKEQIIKINTASLEWFYDQTGFFYVWGMPGPDYNKYTKETYGKGWAFTEEEIFKAWGEE